MATIQELESFNLGDAVKFHDTLNPNLWVDDKLDPEVRDQLLLIAQDFVSTLGISDLDIEDITVSGSNAAFSYTPHSDLDLHIVVNIPKLHDEVYKELFTAKKTLYNDSHDITVHGVPVELYVQDINEPVQSLGEYSVLDDKWIHVPKKKRANFDEASTKAKFENLKELVELALKTKNLDRVEKTIDTIRRYRKAGLHRAGEFGPENLAFKAIRSQGGIDALYDLRNDLRSKKLSIEEAADRDDAVIKIKKLLNTAGRTDNEKENIKRIVSNLMQQWNITPEDLGIRQPVDPLKAKLAKAAYEKQMAHDAMSAEWDKFKNRVKGIFAEDDVDEDYDPNGPPPGPEFKPTMPAGTVRVDVSDVYDWYKLGQHISNLDQVDPSIFGKGPPSTIMAFGTEPEEHKYIKSLNKLGLNTTDIDPKDPKQPKGLPRQSVDTTYNVNEAPRTFQSQVTPLEKLIQDYGYFTSFGTVHLDKQATTPDGQQQLLGLVQRLQKDSKSFNGLDKQKMEANRDTILNHIYQMMQYAIPILKKHLPADAWEAKRGQINSVLTAYNNARQINEEILDETTQESQLVNSISKKAASIIIKTLSKNIFKSVTDVIFPDIKKHKLEIYGISAEQLGIPYTNDPVLSQVLSHSKFRVIDYINPLNPGTLASYDDISHDITIYYPTIKRLAKLQEYTVYEMLAKTIAHELQHAVDNIKSKGEVFNPTGEYLTLPYEINARFQEALMNLSVEFDNARKAGKTMDRKHLPAFIEYVLDHNRISDFLPKTGSRYKQLVKRIYKFYEAEMNNPTQEKPMSLAKRALNYILGKPTSTVNEASGYIPSEAEKDDPRWKMALTKDVRPDANKKNAKAFGWKVSRAGIPPTANPNGKF